MLTAPASFQINYPPYRMQAPSGRPTYPMAYSTNTRQINGLPSPYSAYPTSPSVRGLSTFPVNYSPVQPAYTSSPAPSADVSKQLLAMGALALGGMAAMLYRHRSLASHEPFGPNLVIPQEFQDPRYCDQVAYRIVDEAFPKLMALLTQYPSDNEKFWKGSEAIYEEAIQRHVAPNVCAGFDYYACEQYSHSGETGRNYKWLDQDKDKPEQEPMFYIGRMSICGADPFRHFNEGPLRQRCLQNWYSTFLHETRHVLQDYSQAQQPDPPTPAEIARHDPLRKYESDLQFPYEPAGGILFELLQNEKYPHSSDISFGILNEAPQEKLEGYWKDLQQFWLRKDFPLFDQKTKALYKEIFTHPDAKRSKLLDFRINNHIIAELESYLIARKRMPGSTKKDVAPSDIRSMANAMYLRDMLRLYFQVNNTPMEKRHPYAQISPLTMIS